MGPPIFIGGKLQRHGCYVCIELFNGATDFHRWKGRALHVLIWQRVLMSFSSGSLFSSVKLAVDEEYSL